MTKSETINEALRATPPVGVGGLVVWGVSLNDWVLLATLAYTAFLIIDKVPAVLQRLRDFRAWIKEKRNV